MRYKNFTDLIVAQFGTPNELALQLGITKGAIYQWITKNQIPHSKRTPLFLLAERKKINIELEELSHDDPNPIIQARLEEGKLYQKWVLMKRRAHVA